MSLCSSCIYALEVMQVAHRVKMFDVRMELQAIARKVNKFIQDEPTVGAVFYYPVHMLCECSKETSRERVTMWDFDYK